MANRTLEFYGYAYGNTPVQLNAHINGTTVFSGAVTTLNEPFPAAGPDMTAAPVLFSVADSDLFPDTFAGEYPMTISIATGDGVAIANVFCHYMEFSDFEWIAQTTGSSITANVWTVGTVTEGAIAVGQAVVGEGVPFDRTILVTRELPNNTWNINWEFTATGNIGTGAFADYYGNATAFHSAYDGIPTNTDNTADPRSSVTIDGVPENPDRGSNNGTWTWLVAQGSTLSCNLNVSVGNTA